jgi:DNA-directed RNA polymerase beta' subunit
MYLGLEPTAREALLDKIKSPLRESLSQIQIDPNNKYKLKAELARIYRAIEPGKSVGIITAQSVGEMQTQMNLNTFHQAGHRDQNTEKASRLQELTCTSKSKTQSSPFCQIIHDPGELHNHEIMRALIFKTFEDYIVKYELEKAQTVTAPWEEVYCTFYGTSLANFTWRHVYYLNKDLLYRFRIDLETIVSKLREVVIEDNIEFTFSPVFRAQICLYATGARSLKSFHKQLAAVILQGIPGIKHAYFVPKTLAPNSQAFIETEGTNLSQILRLPFVNTYETSSNDMWEILEIFGIEASRQFLVEEFGAIMPSVDSSHTELLADRMTVSGKLRSMTRYTRKSELRASVLSKLTFEETMKRSTEAAFKEQVDNVIGCSSSVICGRLPSVGSGLNELHFKWSN